MVWLGLNRKRVPAVVKAGGRSSVACWTLGGLGAHAELWLRGLFSRMTTGSSYPA